MSCRNSVILYRIETEGIMDLFGSSIAVVYSFTVSHWDNNLTRNEEVLMARVYHEEDADLVHLQGEEELQSLVTGAKDMPTH